MVSGGVLDEGVGSLCRMSILRNVDAPCHSMTHVPCRLLDTLMLYVDFKKWPICRTPRFYSHVTRVHVDFKKCLCMGIDP